MIHPIRRVINTLDKMYCIISLMHKKAAIYGRVERNIYVFLPKSPGFTGRQRAKTRGHRRSAEDHSAAIKQIRKRPSGISHAPFYHPRTLLQRLARLPRRADRYAAKAESIKKLSRKMRQLFCCHSDRAAKPNAPHSPSVTLRVPPPSRREAGVKVEFALNNEVTLFRQGGNSAAFCR